MSEWMDEWVNGFVQKRETLNGFIPLITYLHSFIPSDMPRDAAEHYPRSLLP